MDSPHRNGTRTVDDGRFDRERQRRALQMWARKDSYEEIGRQLGCSGWVAKNLVKYGLANLEVPTTSTRRRQEAEALDQIERIVWGVVARPGYKVSNGHIVFEPQLGADGRAVPVADQTNRLAAIATLLHIQERRSRLNGLDAPGHVDVSVTLEAAIAAVELLEREADRAEAEMCAQATRCLPRSMDGPARPESSDSESDAKGSHRGSHPRWESAEEGGA